MSADYSSAKISYGPTPTTISLLDLVKLRLNIVDNSQDDELSMYLQIAGEACEAYCDNVLAEQDVVEQHAMTSSPVALRYYPFSVLNTVTVDGEDVTSDYETFESEGVDYVTKSRVSIERGDQFKQMNIDYTAGYDPLPADLGTAIVVAAISYEQGTGATGEVKKESVVGVGSIEYTTASDASSGATGFLSASVTGTLDKYRRDYC
jgi:hypothetical protein